MLFSLVQGQNNEIFSEDQIHYPARQVHHLSSHSNRYQVIYTILDDESKIKKHLFFLGILKIINKYRS